MFLRIWAVCAAMVVSGVCAAQGGGAIVPKGAAKAPNTNSDYVAMCAALPSAEGVMVKDLTLERQGGSFHFTDGNFFFYGDTLHKVTGAVFIGQGHFKLAPKEAREQRSLALVAKGGVLSQDFTTLVLRFTDGTADEIRKATAGSAGPTTTQAVKLASDTGIAFRQKLHENFELRLLSDAMKTEPGEFFLASFRMGGIFTGRNALFIVDPEETPDEVQLRTWVEDEGTQTWAAYRMEGLPGAGHGVPLHVKAETLDVGFEKSGMMHGVAETTLTAVKAGERVVRLRLYPTLRVSAVYGETGEALDFVQEKKEYDPQFAVILPQAMKSGETIRLLTKYDGKDVVFHEGDGVYYLGGAAREDWYPAGYEEGAFANFHMTFHLPKGLQIVATGKQISLDKEADGGMKAVWATEYPIQMAGFNLGNFAMKQATTPDGFTVSAYANVKMPDWMDNVAQMANDEHLGDMDRQGFVNVAALSTVPALQYEVQQGNAAIQIYSEFFGKLPYDHVALTEQGTCSFGQSWPMLVYLPLCGFWTTAMKSKMDLLLDGGGSYWNHVTPHEVAHQWWGQMVGFNSYRDQWMSEGFSDFSVSLFLASTDPNMDHFRDFWKEEKDKLLKKSAQGKRLIDVGPLTMGVRVANEKTGDIYQDLIYSKGAYVMHMLQLLYWTPQQGDKPFRDSIQQFVKEFKGKSATTEDFKASFEKTMPKWMDVAHDGKLDWFFNDYVYGTELPHYEVASEFNVDDKGETTVHFRVTQSHVSDDFLMMVPVYLRMQDGQTVRITNVVVKGNGVSEHRAKIGKLPSPAKTMLVNYNEDVLSD